MASGSLGEGAAEVVFEVLGDLFLDQRFEEDQHEPKPGPDPDFIFPHGDLPIDPGTFEVNMVAFPAIIDFEFLRQVARKLVRGFLRFFRWHGVPCEHIYMGHRLNPNAPERISLDVMPKFDQSSAGPGGL